MWKYIKVISLLEAAQRSDPVGSFSLSAPQYLVLYVMIQFDSVVKKLKDCFSFGNPAIHLYVHQYI